MGKRVSPIKKIVLHIGALILAFWILAPFFWLIISSISPTVDLYSKPPNWIPRTLYLESYTQIFNPKIGVGGFIGVNAAARVIPSLINSTIINLMVTAYNLVVGCLGGYALARYRFRFGDKIAFILLATRMFPAIVLLIPYFLLFKALGLVDTYLGLFIAYNAITLPFSIWILKSYFETVPKDLDDAALIDGCTRIQVLYKIILPVAVPGLISAGIFTFLTGWSEFLMALILTVTTKTVTVPVVVSQFVGQQQIEWNGISAAGVLGALPPVLLALLFQKYIVRGLMGGAVKA